METLDARWLGYAVGAVGVVLEWRSYAMTCDRRFRRWSALGALLWAMQYLFLQAYTAALTMACTAARTLLSQHRFQAWAKHAVAAGFVGVFAVLTFMSWQGPVSLLPAFAVINTSLALFYLQQRAMRLALLLSSCAWLSNDWYWQAWPALLAESVAMLINGRTIQRWQTELHDV